MKGRLLPILCGLLAFAAASAFAVQTDPAPVVVFTPAVVELPSDPAAEEGVVDPNARPVESWLEAQIELSRRGFSCGPIDGVGGAQTGAALRVFQLANGLEPNGRLDTATLALLQLTAPAFFVRSLSAEDLAALQPVSATWLGKSEQSALAFETALEAIAERYHAHPNLVRKMNCPSICQWSG